MRFTTKNDTIALMVKRMMKIETTWREESRFSHPFLRASSILKNVPLAANPKRAILITMKER